MDYIIFLITGSFFDSVQDNQQLLPVNLSKYRKVTCFEYPQFKKILNFNQYKIENLVHSKLTLFRSFGIFPFGRTLRPINYLNFKLSYRFFHLLANRIDTDKTEVISFTPEVYFLRKELKNANIYYYVIDDYLSYPCWKNKLAQKQFLYLEKNLLRIAKKVIVSSQPLFNKYKKFHKKVIYFPNPADLTPFNQENKKKLAQLKLPRPTIGYIGGIENYRFNFQLIHKAAKTYQDFSFVFVGPIGLTDKTMIKDLPKAKNIYFLPRIPHEEIVDYINAFDICIIPYRLNQYGKMCFPIKIYEYMATGKPIVTTAIPSIKHLKDKELIYWSRNNREFIQNIKLALDETKKSQVVQQRIGEAKKNDWDIRIKEFLNIVED